MAFVAIGWGMIYTAGYKAGYPNAFSDWLSTPLGKQTIWIAISIAVLFLVQTLHWRIWFTHNALFYIGAILLLVLVLIFGKTIKGATSWFVIGGLSLQPSEFAKFATCLILADVLGRHRIQLKYFSHQVLAISLFVLPMLLILLQPDAGSALVFLSFFLLLYRAGFPGAYYLVGGSAITFFVLGLVFSPEQILPWLFLVGLAVLSLSAPKKAPLLIGCLIAAWGTNWALQHGYRQALLVSLGAAFLIGCLLAWVKLKKPSLAVLTTLSLSLGLLISFSSNYAYNNFLEPHQQERIKVWLKPSECDPEGAAYNLIFSKMAIGSGGLYGKGLLKGDLTQGNFVPEQITDFIFCTIGEEQGFIGSLGLLLLFLMFLWRIVVIAERQNSLFSKYYAYGVVGIFFIHIFINIGMTMGLTPIIGIPLPFLSKGGSSLLGFTLMLAVLLKLDRHRLEIKI